MRLTYFTDYALRLLMFAAAHEDRLITIEEVTEVYKISRGHLMKVTNTLTRAGYLTAVRGRSGGQGRPGQRVLGGDCVDAVGFEVADELPEQPAGVGELEPQRPAQVQVVTQRVAQRRSMPGHAVSPGQGRASWRSASTSTFA